MSRKRRNELVAGLFIFVSTGLFFVMLILMGSLRNLFQPYKEVEVVFDDVQGLRRGEPVFFLGRKVGIVRDLEFRGFDEEIAAAEGEPPQRIEMSRVLVTLALPEEHWNLLKVDSPVVVDRSITGNLSVHIREGRSSDYLRKRTERVTLRGDVTFDFDETSQKLTVALEKANGVLTEITRLLENVREGGQIQSILRDLADTTKEIQSRAGPVLERVNAIADEIDGVLKENREGVKTAVANISESSRTLREFFDERFDPAVASLTRALEDGEQTVAALRDTVTRNRSRLDDLVRALAQAAVNAENLTAEVRRRPWRLLYEPDAAEMESLGLYDAAWAYNLSAAALKTSLQEIHALSRLESAADPEVLDRALEVVESNLRRQREAEDALYAMLKSRVEK